MKKLALLSLITAGVALVSSIGANNGKQAKAYAEASSSAITHTASYGTTRRIIIDASTHSELGGLYLVPIYITVDGTQYTNNFHHAKDQGCAYDEYYNLTLGDVAAFDVPIDSAEIQDIRFTGPATSEAMPNNLSEIITDYELTSPLPYAIPSSPWAYLKVHFDVVKVQREFSVSFSSGCGWHTTGTPGKLIPTIVEGCFTCSESEISGYKAADEIQALIPASDWTTYKDYGIYDLGLSDPTTITVAAKLEEMHRMNGSTPASSLTTSSTLGSKSYLWVIAIAGTAAILSIAAVVIASDKKKRAKTK